MSVRKSLAWSYGSQAVTFLVTFASSLIVARLLSPREMGVFAIAMATSAIIASFTSFSTQAYIVREGKLDQTLLRSIFTVNAILSVVLAAATFLIGFVQSYFFGEHDVGAVLMLTSIGPLIGMFEFVPAALYMREMNYGVLTSVGVARSVITAVVIVSAAYAGFGSLSPAIGPLVAGLFSLTYYNVRRRRDIVLRPHFHNLRPIFVFGAQMMSISGVAGVASRVCDIILGRMLGLAALGLYSRASSLSNLIFTNVYGLATGVLFVKLSNDLRDTGQLHATFVRSLKLITAVMWPLLIGLAILARPAILILYGEKWLPAALPLSLLMIAQVVVLGFGMNWELFVLRKETALQTRYEAARAIVGVAIFAIGCTISIAAAAAGRIAEALVGYFLYRPHMDRMAGTQPGELERVYLDSLLLTIAAAWPALILMIWQDWSATTSPLLIAGAVAIGAVGWSALLITLGHPIVDELKRVQARFRKSGPERSVAL